MAAGRDSYEWFYSSAGEDLREWRLLGATEKSKSVLELTDGLVIRDVIDIGAGTGALLERLVPARLEWRFEALDIASTAVESIKRLHLPGVEARVFDGVHLAYPDKAFDLAILCHVVEHLENPTPLIGEAARIARWIFIEVPVEGTPALDAIWWVRKLLGRDRTPNASGHLHFCSRSEWDRLFEHAGIRVTRSRQYTLQKEILMFGQRGLGLYKAKLKALAERLVGPRLWANLYHSNYAILGPGSTDV